MSCRCHVRRVWDKYTGVYYCPRCHTARTLSKKAEKALRELERPCVPPESALD